MRAETQNTVDAIEKSLALLRQRMDFGTAQHRLEEYNARVEDPNLWDDPDAAQKLMRDRQSLVDSLETLEGIARDLSDNVELIECDADGPKISRRFDLVHPSKYVAYLKQMDIEYGK